MATVLIGTQWGDEGKGKVIDYICKKSDIIARCAGGNNAGHTLKVNNEEMILHHIPSGILYKDKINVIGNGVVVDPLVLKQELDMLKAKKVVKKRRISSASLLYLESLGLRLFGVCFWYDIFSELCIFLSLLHEVFLNLFCFRGGFLNETCHIFRDTIRWSRENEVYLAQRLIDVTLVEH